MSYIISQSFEEHLRQADLYMAMLALSLRVASARVLVILSGSFTSPSLCTESGLSACQADGNSE